MGTVAILTETDLKDSVQLDLDTRRPAALTERLRAAAARLLVQVAM